MRILESRMTFRELVAKALGFDYAGALIGSIGFSLWLLPHFGLARTTLACGLLNASVGVASTWLLLAQTPGESRKLVGLRWVGVATVITLWVAIGYAPTIARLSETQRFGHASQTIQSAYQRIVLSEHHDNLELFLNGRLQFASVNERRYHEALVHPVLAASPASRHVLIGGGGDGLAAREVLKWPAVESLVLVDIDPVMTHLAQSEPKLTQLNQRSLLDPKVTVINDDAMHYLEYSALKFDAIILDFPDPTYVSLGKLYSTQFYSIVKRHLQPGGTLGVQCTSPLLTRKSYWMIIATLEQIGLHVIPYRVFVPSFGDWGFALARPNQFCFPTFTGVPQLKTLDKPAFEALVNMPSDTQRIAANANGLDDQLLVATYLREAARFEQ